MMSTRRNVARAVVCLVAAALASPADGQKTATVMATVDTAGGIQTIGWGGCSVTVVDTVPNNVQTNVVRLRIVTSADEQLRNAPHPLTMRVAGRDSVRIAAVDSGASLRLTESPLHESTITLSRQGDRAVLCAVDVPKDEDDEEGAEIDPAFELLMGIELLSVDGFAAASPYVPAAAQWVIPVRVHPFRRYSVARDDSTWNLRRYARYRGRRQPASVLAADTIRTRGNVYSLLTTSAEYSRLLGAQGFHTCAPLSQADLDADVQPDREVCPVAVADGGENTVYRAVRDSAVWDTRATWRIQSRFRWEWNMGFADRDVFLGPVVTAGIQTDPGYGIPDFTPLGTLGLSLTQVDVTDEYWVERFNVQMAFGRFPNYQEDVYLQSDSTVLRTSAPMLRTERWHLSTVFQPANGYFVRGSVEFGRGVPDVARIGVGTRVDVSRLIGSLLGSKERE